jgi:hypothetical protein
MIILDERNYLQKELKTKGFDIFDFFENHQVLDVSAFCRLDLKRRSEFVVVDVETFLSHPELVENFKTVLNTFMGAIFFHDHSNTKALDWIKGEGAVLSKILGAYSLPMDQVNWTILTNQLQFFWNLIEDQKRLQNHLVSFSLELDQVLQSAHEEMNKAKKIHESLVPRRKEEIKGIIFSNKYSAGDGGGGEFYDIIQTPSKVYQILMMSQSYLISSAVMGILSAVRDHNFDPHQFLKLAQGEAENINRSKNKKSEFDLLILELDLVTLQLIPLTDSKAEGFSSVRGGMMFRKGQSLQLERGEKVIVFSSGFLFNWRDAHPKKDHIQFTKDHVTLPITGLVSELLFELREGEKGNVLRKDATVVTMEVNRHGIHKV